MSENKQLAATLKSQDTEEWLDIYFGGAVPDFMPELSVQSTPLRLSA